MYLFDVKTIELDVNSKIKTNKIGLITLKHTNIQIMYVYQKTLN